MRAEQLSFDLRIASTEGDLAAAREVRASAYGHHVPELLEGMLRPDPADRQPGTLVLLARDRVSGRPIGTARITTNAHRPLQLERGYELPEELKGWHLAEITRLAVEPSGDDKLVKRALMKACYLACLSMQVQKMVIGARSSALIRGYRSIGFECLTATSGPVELAHAGGLPHHILAFDVTSAERVWYGISHPLYEWMVRTFHPSINVSPAPMFYEPSGESSSPKTLGILDSRRRRSAEPVEGSASTA